MADMRVAAARDDRDVGDILWRDANDDAALSTLSLCPDRPNLIEGGAKASHEYTAARPTARTDVRRRSIADC